MDSTVKKTYNSETARQVLEQLGINPSKTNIKKAVDLAPSLDRFKGYVDELELKVGAQKLASQLSRAQSLKATKPIATALDDVTVPRYNIWFDDTKQMLTFDPTGGFSPHGLRATRGINVGRSEKGGVEITLGDDNGGTLNMEKAKWAKATLGDLARGPKDLKRMEDEGYNIHALRDVLVVKTEDGKQTYFAVRDSRLDKNAPDTGDDSRAAVPPGFAGPKPPDLTRGLIAVGESCTEIHVVGFEHGKPQIMIRKPVVYFYPTKKTRVRMEVQPSGQFTAQYPETSNGVWDIVATPDGMLFDPKTERRYSYIFWEAESPRSLAIDPSKAFCVRAEEVETFLEKACTQIGLNDREKTDFISYWIAPLKKNPISMIQFLTGGECSAYAKMSVEPAPESEIRMFMMFQRVPEPVATGNPVLPAVGRTGYTVVEWGGTNLDE